VGQKRKRTTRKSTRDEQKRRELENAPEAFPNYVPPSKPIIKAKDVPVPVIRDVCLSLSSSLQWRTKLIGLLYSLRADGTKSSMMMMGIIL
jgi:hypothetical protein